MKILITAFESFGKRDVNASLAVMEAIPFEIGQHQVVKKMLPVDHKNAPMRLEAILTEIHPDAVICLGEAGGSDYIRLEYVSINWMDFRIPDNSGVIITDERILDEGKNAYFSTLPLRKFELQLTEKDIPVKISMTAGTYLCNQIFFTLMHYLESNDLEVPAGFIHLPAGIIGDEDAEQKCDLDLCVDGVKLILGILAN